LSKITHPPPNLPLEGGGDSFPEYAALLPGYGLLVKCVAS
jgi:hypothetical protein